MPRLTDVPPEPSVPSGSHAFVTAGAPGRSHRLGRALAWTASGCVVLGAAIWVASQVSRWPSTLVIRTAFDKGGREANDALTGRVPDDVAAIRDVPYRPGDTDAVLDVYFPSALAADEALPTIVWTHGGGWVSGSKDHVASYAQILAGHRYTVVAIDYTIAPEARYPTPVVQLNAALEYVTANAAALHVDPRQIILAGDSAGSQIAAQVATLVTSPDYAKLVGITPSIGPDALVGVVLHCGPYDMALASVDGAFGWFIRSVLWAYTGEKNFRDDAAFDAASVVNHVTGDFPAAYLTGGDGDGLTVMGKAFHARLVELGVEATGVFPEQPEAPLGHEYQFDLSEPAGQEALDGTLAFLEAHTSR
ncbi:Acetyl esterase/lipase [Sanguibacter gelidistatuariae]|uniref:Acetyl esterase/lipase n=1 Tax=Sanguibacter gelidistatuariae TaxID=1814289 RepID=A0A1G6H6Z8_9MICO|nr:alpha/beta hydrolase [Sanguibacter gelidistatuariae]SDB90037.1 Acetyl esterase/lipase [Sanguibacter gelidistatuariae]